MKTLTLVHSPETNLFSRGQVGFENEVDSGIIYGLIFMIWARLLRLLVMMDK